MSEFNQFPDYQSLESGSKGASAKANRSIPDRIKDYGLMDFIKGMDREVRVLDLGCNRGFFGTALSPHISHYTGIDSDKNQLSHAQPTGNMTLKNEEFTGAGGQFEIILCLAFHSYVSMGMKEFATQLNSMLAPEGYLFLEGHPKGYRGEPQEHLSPLKRYLKDNLCVLESRQVKDRELKRPFLIYQKMSGMVSKCVKKGDVIEKHYYPDKGIYKERNTVGHWNTELYALEMLGGAKHFPQLLGATHPIMKMSYCGERLTKKNCPKDWRKQCKEIDDAQRKHGIYHVDVRLKNITVLNGVIHLIDWGLTSIHKGHLQPIRKVIYVLNRKKNELDK